MYPELITDLIAFHNMYLYMMVAFSTGEMVKYMLYKVHMFDGVSKFELLNYQYAHIPALAVPLRPPLVSKVHILVTYLILISEIVYGLSARKAV